MIPDFSTEQLAHQITMAGLEVDDAIEPVAGAFSGVVVAEIISAEQHPDADKLRVVPGGYRQRDCADRLWRTQCPGGLKAPLAQIGARAARGF